MLTPINARRALKIVNMHLINIVSLYLKLNVKRRIFIMCNIFDNMWIYLCAGSFYLYLYLRDNVVTPLSMGFSEKYGIKVGLKMA